MVGGLIQFLKSRFIMILGVSAILRSCQSQIVVVFGLGGIFGRMVSSGRSRLLGCHLILV